MERNPRRWPVHAAVVAAGLLAIACAGTVRQAGVADGVAATNTVVAVENNNWLDAVVYLVRGAARTRLGAVRSLGAAEFRIPDAYVLGTSDLTLMLRMIGGSETYTSPEILVFRGAHVVLRVEKQLSLTTYAVHDLR